MSTIGIVSAMQEEIIAIVRKMKVTKTITIAMINFHVGEIAGQKVVLARLGAGQVNATICTQVLIDHFKIDYLISTGVAEGLYPSIKIGDIIISADTTGHGKDVTKQLIEMATSAAEKAKGNPNLYISHTSSKDPVYYAEMEGTAIEYTCFANRIPFIMLRVISDKIGQVVGVDNHDFVHSTVRNISFIIEKMLKEN